MFRPRPEYDTLSHHLLFLLIGIIVIGVAVKDLSSSFTSKSELIAIKGTVGYVNMNYKTVKNSRTRQPNYITHLTFYLNQIKKEFKLVEHEKYSEKHIKIAKGLKQADSITVWIKKNEIENYSPKIFGIDTDRKTLLSFEDVRTENGYFPVIFLSMGLLCILYFFYLRYPEKMKELFYD
ncbi:hypothetical protein GCM10007424_01510 [Flavobacterium suaedae]|uniref:DUF3592 domain-containing protein n=1 Tax=Flavobacterium suaedae TaxID=1767027 RepID=A0ABQ1JFX1_9FLAO|nr:hypothetical protein [Flavobacterium suaedae]GGB65293.1 hypothetical protein GCM10007424_01510 [Flavobacterium suaedae]